MDNQALFKEMALERKAIEKTLSGLLRQQKGIPPRLKKAMAHSLLGGGKRLRPLLLLWTYDAFCGGRRRPSVSREMAMEAACALEMLHTYSLIHDDLPAMDDDVLRRGRPTCHVEFDEATAILAGDALQALGFSLLGHCGGPVAGDLVQVVGRAVGPAGMVGGQQNDLDAEQKEVTANMVRNIHLGKTAALLAAALEAGALLAKVPSGVLEEIYRSGLNIGLAFQGADDVLDVTSTSEQLGKSIGKDEAAGKATWVRVEGLAKAQARTARYGRLGLNGLMGVLPGAETSDRLIATCSLLWNRDH